MLPRAVSSAEREKIQRQSKQSNGFSFAQRVSNGRLGFSMRPDKYEKYQSRSSRTVTARRRATLIRLGVVLAILLLSILFFIPSLRPTSILGALTLGLFSYDGSEAFQIETVRYYDLSHVSGTSRGWERGERILLCAPLRDAADHLPMFFSHLRNLTYPHHLIDLAFLVGDSKDNTTELLSDYLAQLQASGAKDVDMPFGEISVIEKDFGQKVKQDSDSRHGFAAQASRRKSMAQARNWLLSAALRPTHSWVYWRDVDVETAPAKIVEDLMKHNADVIVPNVWRPLPDWLGGEQPYDLNSWQESETALELAKTLDEDAVIVEGYAEYATWRPHLAYLRDPYGDPDTEMDLDGVGGVSILAKAKVFRSGVHFPAFSFEKHAETEGFGKMARRMQYSVVGLPHYTIWHLYEPSADDLRHMAEMDKEKKKLAEEADATKAREELITSQFDVTAGKSQWEKDKEALRQNALAREDAKAPVVATKQDAKIDQVPEKQEVGANEKPAEKIVEDNPGGDDGKSKAPKKIAPAAFVAANAPLGNLVAKTQEKLQHKQQQQQLQRHQTGSSNANDPDKTSPQPAPDHAAAVAAANVARQGSGSQEGVKGS